MINHPPKNFEYNETTSIFFYFISVLLSYFLIFHPIVIK